MQYRCTVQSEESGSRLDCVLGFDPDSSSYFLNKEDGEPLIVDIGCYEDLVLEAEVSGLVVTDIDHDALTHLQAQTREVAGWH